MTAWRYAAAVAIIGVALLVTVFFRGFFEVNAFLLLFPAILLSAWIGGAGTGLLATFLSALFLATGALVGVSLLPPEGGSNVVRIALFVGVGALLSGVTANLRAAREQAREHARALEESEGRLRTALGALPMGVWFADEQGRIDFVNEAGRRIWGLERGQHRGLEPSGDIKAWWLDSGKLIAPEEWALTRAIRHRETSLDEEIRIQAFDGTQKIIRNSAVPVLAPDGRLLGAVIVNEDITERIRTERA